MTTQTNHFDLRQCLTNNKLQVTRIDSQYIENEVLLNAIEYLEKTEHVLTPSPLEIIGIRVLAEMAHLPYKE